MSLTTKAEPPHEGTAMPGVVQDPEVTKRPSSSGLRQFIPTWTPKLITGLTITGAVILFAVIAPFFVASPSAIGGGSMQPPSGEHWLGTTQIGQDVFAQLAWGARGSLIIGVAVGVISMVLSCIFGVVGAYYGGLADNFFSLITNSMLVIPGLPLMIVIASYLRGGSIWVLVIVFSITSWAGGARVLRGQVLSLRSRDYVLAARVAGERTWRIIVVEILPNLLPILASGFVFSVIFAVLGEAGLSFIGLGPSGSYTWGRILYDAQGGMALRFGAWWWFLPPGMMIAMLGAGLSFINFSIDEVINPRLRQAKKQSKRDLSEVSVSAVASADVTAAGAVSPSYVDPSEGESASEGDGQTDGDLPDADATADRSNEEG